MRFKETGAGKGCKSLEMPSGHCWGFRDWKLLSTNSLRITRGALIEAVADFWYFVVSSNFLDE